jgi:hypothetical protein
MKKSIALVVVAGIFVCLAPHEALAKTKIGAPPPAESTLKAPKIDPKKVKEMLAKKRTDLENTSWNIQVTTSGKENRKSEDVLFFKDNQVASQELLAKGFKPTNYTLTLTDDGVIVFETMQTHPKDGTVFWRGELGQGNAMKGMISRISSDQKTQDYYFSGIQGGPVPLNAFPASAKAEPPVEMKAKAPEIPSTQDNETSNKK